MQRAGHNVRTPRSERISGTADAAHLAHAASKGYTLITKNPDAFELLHHEWQQRGQAHHGIPLIYQDNRHRKDMRPDDIVRAIGKLLASGLPIANEMHSLNAWR